MSKTNQEIITANEALVGAVNRNVNSHHHRHQPRQHPTLLYLRPFAVSVSDEFDIVANDLPAFMKDLSQKEIVAPDDDGICIISLDPATLKVLAWRSSDYSALIGGIADRGSEMSRIMARYAVHHFRVDVSGGEINGDAESGRSLERQLGEIEWLVGRFGADAVGVRFCSLTQYYTRPDPVTGAASPVCVMDNLGSFATVARRCSCIGINTVALSLMRGSNLDVAFARRLYNSGYTAVPMDLECMVALGDAAFSIARKVGVSVAWCSDIAVAERTGMPLSKCINQANVRRLLLASGIPEASIPVPDMENHHHRPGSHRDCGCMFAIDVVFGRQ